jgi:predicted transcriptional regulator
MEALSHSHTGVSVSTETKARVKALAEAGSCTQNDVVAAGLDALTFRTLAGNGAVRLDLIRALETLEVTVALAAESNVRLAELCSLLCESRLALIEQSLAAVEAAAKGGK